MNDADVAVQPWPPAFSEAFLDGARALFRDTDHVMIVGPLGSHRGALASALVGPSAPTAWGRETQTFGATANRYAALNQLLPNLQARPDEALRDVVARAESILARTFGRPTMFLREADLCDHGSVEVLTRLVETQHIALVSTLGPAAADSHPFARTAARLDLPPLDDDTITHLLSARFGAAPHPTTVAMLAERSQRAYAVLKGLADAGFATGQIKAISGSLVTDVAVSVEDVNEVADPAAAGWSPRFAADHPARDLIDVAALAMSLDRDEARLVFGEGELAAALSLGALRASGARIVFAARIEAMMVRRGLTTARRTELHDRYADRLPGTSRHPDAAPQVTEWALSIGRSVSPELAARAATRANLEGRYHVTLQFVASIPREERPSRLLIEQCHALSESGDAVALVELLRSIDATALHDDDILPYLRWSSRYLPHAALADVMGTIRASTDPENLGRVAVLTLSGLFGEAYQTGSEKCRHALRALAMSGHLSPVSQAMAQSAIATSLRQASRVDQAIDVAAAAIDALMKTDDAAACNVEAALENQIMCHIAAADLDGAHDALSRYSQPGVAFGNLGRVGTALWALHAFLSGDISSALAHAQLCLARTPASDPHRMRGWMEAMAAQILTQVGDIDQVYDLLAASHRNEHNPRRQHDLERRIAQACVHDAIGDPEKALDLLQAVVDEAHEHDLTLLEVDAAVLHVQIGGPIHLDQLLRAVKTIDETCGTSWIWQRFAWAVRDNAMRDLVALAEELDADGLALYAAEVAQFTLDIARRAADMTPDQRQRLVAIADPMQHRHVTRPGQS